MMLKNEKVYTDEQQMGFSKGTVKGMLFLNTSFSVNYFYSRTATWVPFRKSYLNQPTTMLCSISSWCKSVKLFRHWLL